MADLWTSPLPAPIPEWAVTPSAMNVFMFSAVTWNRHVIHYDKDAAIGEGHSGVVVQRALLGNYFARMLGRWLGSQGDVRNLAWRVLTSAHPGDRLRCHGRLVAREERGEARWLFCELHMDNDSGAQVASGHAWLELRP